MFNVQCTVCSVQFSEYRVQCAVTSVQCTVCSVQFSEYRVQCAVSSVQCLVCSVECLVCSVQCTVCSVQCTVCSVQCWIIIAVINKAAADHPVTQLQGGVCLLSHPQYIVISNILLL